MRKKVEVSRPVPMSFFGKDHWSTFGYIECCIVDHQGFPALEHMRTDRDRHPGLCHHHMFDLGNKKYPTRLKDFVELENHDDWDCAEDLESAGLIKDTGTGINPCYRMTDFGCEIAKQLRKYKGAGGNFASFVPQLDSILVPREIEQ